MTNTPDPEFQRLLKDLREVLANCGPTLNDSDIAYTIISGCIIGELNTKLRMLQMAKALRRNTRQVAAVLDSRTGNYPERHDWYVDENGRYWLH